MPVLQQQNKQLPLRQQQRVRVDAALQAAQILLEQLLDSLAVTQYLPSMEADTVAAAEAAVEAALSVVTEADSALLAATQKLASITKLVSLAQRLPLQCTRDWRCRCGYCRGYYCLGGSDNDGVPILHILLLLLKSKGGTKCVGVEEEDRQRS